MGDIFEATANRRIDERYPFECDQRIAVCKAGERPAEDAFHKVRCHNISRGGISFYYPTAPKFTDFVIELGCPPIFIFATVLYTLKPPGAGSVLVGSKFNRRMSVAFDGVGLGLGE